MQACPSLKDVLFCDKTQFDRWMFFLALIAYERILFVKQHQGATMISETTIHPGIGIGNDIRLGLSMYETITQLNKYNYKLHVTYSDKNYLKMPVLVTIVDYGIRLSFKNSDDQSLQLIELLDISMANMKRGGCRRLLGLLYNGVKLNEFERIEPLSVQLLQAEPQPDGLESCSSLSSDDRSLVSTCNTTLRLIYNKIFGPTYPGKLGKKSYILSYPGVSFKFRILNDDLFEKVSVEMEEEMRLSMLLNWDIGDEIICDSIAIFKGNSWNEFNYEQKMNFVDPVSSGFSTPTSATLESSKNSENTIQKLHVELEKGLIEVHFKAAPVALISIGATSQQQVLNILGPPDDYFNKFDSPLLIHNKGANGEARSSLGSVESDADTSHYKFHNYFRFGLDILYDINCSGKQGHATVKKIVVHNGGIAECLNFMKWNRCNWELNTNGTKINSGMNFEELPNEIKGLIPVLLNRNESEFVDYDLDIIEMPNEPIAKVGKVKTWGQSKLYGYKRCIFEVIDLNSFISCITVY